MKKSLFILLFLFAHIEQSSASKKVDEFVSQMFIHGVPYEQASEFTRDDISTLLSIIKDPSRMDHWANAIVTLEIIGDENTLFEIIEFIERDPGGEYLLAHHRAKKAAIMGMGYFINKNSSKTALSYLVQSLNPDVWKAREVYGLSSMYSTYEERNMDFSKQALLGLALSGTPVAANEIRRFQSDMKLGTQLNGYSESFQNKVKNLTEFLLEENEIIQSKGMLDYKKNTH